SSDAQRAVIEAMGGGVGSSGLPYFANATAALGWYQNHHTDLEYLGARLHCLDEGSPEDRYLKVHHAITQARLHGGVDSHRADVPSKRRETPLTCVYVADPGVAGHSATQTSIAERLAVDARPRVALPPGVAQLLRDLRAFIHAMSDVQSDDDDFIDRITNALGDGPAADEGVASGPIGEQRRARGRTCCTFGCEQPATRWELPIGANPSMTSYVCDAHTAGSDAVAWLTEAVVAGDIEAFGLHVVPWVKERDTTMNGGVTGPGCSLGLLARLASRMPTPWVVLALDGDPGRPTVVVSYPGGEPERCRSPTRSSPRALCRSMTYRTR
ncbi:MAG: hypothetical protein KC766_16630, partial [Myxococcales bacterium]|nr:hypothetical protein [Myxococcales bacterium]